MATMFEHVGGEATLRKMAEHFHEAVLGDELRVGEPARFASNDELLGKLFRYGSSHHVDHLTAFLAEMLGGPRRGTPAPPTRRSTAAPSTTGRPTSASVTTPSSTAWRNSPSRGAAGRAPVC